MLVITIRLSSWFSINDSDKFVDPENLRVIALNNRNPVDDIKDLRKISGIGLKEAKDSVDEMYRGKEVIIQTANIKEIGDWITADSSIPADNLKWTIDSARTALIAMRISGITVQVEDSASALRRSLEQSLEIAEKINDSFTASIVEALIKNVKQRERLENLSE